MKETIYIEEIQSRITSGLFAGLAVLFLALFGWRVSRVGWQFTPGLFLFLGIFFLLYVFNYRTLSISIFDDLLLLQFGLVRWKVPVRNIQSCDRYDPPWWIKYGGAGVHFVLVEGVYQAFFNFLDGPRVLVTFKEKQGWVGALSFTTNRPSQVLDLLGGRRTA